MGAGKSKSINDFPEEKQNKIIGAYKKMMENFKQEGGTFLKFAGRQHQLTRLYVDFMKTHNLSPVIMEELIRYTADYPDDQTSVTTTFGRRKRVSRRKKFSSKKRRYSNKISSKKKSRRRKRRKRR